MKKIAVLGPIPRDHIVTHQGDLIQKWGCVTHPVIALSILVGDKIEIRNENAVAMSFASDSFDVVFSLLCIHNIESNADQEKACYEIARVLKPNGTAIIGDYITRTKFNGCSFECITIGKMKAVYLNTDTRQP